MEARGAWQLKTAVSGPGRAARLASALSSWHEEFMV
jgi:hypothetical protein